MNHHHFLIISFPIQGHINPILQLSKNLARGGAKVTFATTVRGLRKLQHSLPSINNLSYASFSDGHDQENNQSGGDFIAYMEDLRHIGAKNLTKLVQNFSEQGQPVTCLVYSLLLPWAASVARGLHVPSAFLAIQSATVFAIYHSFFSNKSNSSELSISIPGLPFFSSSDLPTFLLPNNPMNSFMIPIMQEHMQELEKNPKPYVFLNTFQELEQDSIEVFNNKLNAIPIGPLVPSAFYQENDTTDKSFGGDLFIKSDDSNYFKWLDTKQEKSVIYLSFGSLVTINKDQKIEIMHGLLESKRPFMWVIRSSDHPEEDEVVINNTRDIGIVVPWCSQIEVLNHKSIGCFVTHCGWNSTLESLICGIPIIGFPHFSDQCTNAKMLEEVWGTGVRARANGEVVVGREELKKCLDVVMGDTIGDEGKEMRRNAEKWRGLAMEAVREVQPR
ncbi:hypothetical protein ACJIZ3_009759 [Penstemon smallii]|uniref:Glycosyltransferase n=1 Tax=Penstemon smallii TaxID=265156 RepID=A0ABD3TFP1_9LAMI